MSKILIIVLVLSLIPISAFAVTDTNISSKSTLVKFSEENIDGVKFATNVYADGAKEIDWLWT